MNDYDAIVGRTTIVRVICVILTKRYCTFRRCEQFDDFGAKAFKVFETALANLEGGVRQNEEWRKQVTAGGYHFLVVHDQRSGGWGNSRVVEVQIIRVKGGHRELGTRVCA